MPAAAASAKASGVDEAAFSLAYAGPAVRKLARELGVDLGKVKGAIVTFAVGGADHNALKAKLREQAINVTVSTQFSSRLDLKGRGLPNIMRASVHVYNTEEELDRFTEALEATI